MAISDVLTPDPAEVEEAPFGRNRFLALIGGALFGYAAQGILRSEPALGHHNPIPYPCEGFGRCHYCDGSMCYQYCSWYEHSHCRSGGQYWHTCTSNGNLYRCRDWHEAFPNVALHHCICSVGLGRC